MKENSCCVLVYSNLVGEYGCSATQHEECEYYIPGRVGVCKKYLSCRCGNVEAQYDALLKLEKSVAKAKREVGTALKKEAKP